MKKSIIFITIISLSFIACRKEKNVIDGPSVSEIFSDFTILENFKSSRDSVNFKNLETVYFTAKFNKIVSWQIAIKGKTSKSVKTIIGEGREIAINNSTWNGSTSTFPIFAKEVTTATLTIKDVLDSFKVDVKIVEPKAISGFVVADFETGLNPGWTKFAQTGANMDFKVKTDSLAPEGKNYFNMAGTVNWDYLIGLIDFPATAYGANVTYPLSTNPNDVYFNCLLYGVPNTNQSIVLFQFREDENSDGALNANNEDQYDFEVKVDWVGWKLVSIRYADLVSLSNGAPTTPKGNALRNPDKLSKISMLHLANPNDGFASTKIDLIMFTNTKPLEP